MDKLQAFYKSRAWESFRSVVIAQRMDSNGFVRCAHCGQPIVKPYDLIVHHKTELTLANVNDAMVALNPDNVECVHFKCHNKIHDRWQGGNGGWVARPRRVIVVWGAPLAGKTTWVRENATRRDLVVDMDNLWQAVSMVDRYDKPSALKGTVFRLRDALYDEVKHRAGKWQDAYIITGGARRGDRERLSARVGATDFVFVDEGKDVCLMRLESRDMGERERELWRGYILDWFDTYQQ